MAEIRVSPASVDLTIYRGDDVQMLLRLSVVSDGTTTYPDVSGWTGESHIRRDEDSDVLLGEFTVTTDGDVDGENGYFQLECSGSATSLLPRKAVWDLEFTNDEGKKRTYMGGNLMVTPDVTRSSGS